MNEVVFLMKTAAIAFCLSFGWLALAAKPENRETPIVQRPPLQIKTLKIGLSVADVQRLFAGSVRCYGSDSCQVMTRLAEKSAVFQVSFTNDKLDNAYLSKDESSDVEELVEAFRDKYGAPDVVSNRTLQNGYGARFECPVYTWNFPDGTLTVAKYRPEIVALIQVEIMSADRAKQSEAERKRARGDV